MSSEAIRRFAEKTPKQTEFGNMRLEIRDQALCVNGSDEWKHLHAQAFQVLWYLAKADGGVVQTKELADWLNENAPLENQITPDYMNIVGSIIKRLRNVMQDIPSLRVRIANDGPRYGYRLETF